MLMDTRESNLNPLIIVINSLADCFLRGGDTTGKEG
jgi:hypothetical protein